VSEEWRRINGSPFEVSNLGRVRRAIIGKTNGRVGREIKPCLSRAGYMIIGIRYDGRGKVTRLLHKVVAEAFYGPCPDGSEVNHIDSNKLNNRASNLEYITHQKNIDHSIAMGRIRPRDDHGAYALKTADVIAIREALRNGAKQIDLARKHGVNKGTISHIARRKTWRDV
jgi:hypothetical protein